MLITIYFSSSMYIMQKKEDFEDSGKEMKKNKITTDDKEKYAYDNEITSLWVCKWFSLHFSKECIA